MTFLPIVERELRIAARRPATYWLRFFTALSAIVVTLLALWSMNSYMPAAYMAKQTFGTLSMLTMVFCLLAGIFQTADCLSSEKRDGTLGLLFLTDLHGYDVVLGKLAANSLHSCYGLLSALPILAIPLLAGGVTAGEFWRVVLVLLASLFFSLGIGIFVSAITRESRQAMGCAAFLILVISGLLPAIHGILWLLFKIKINALLLWPSPGYALRTASDAYYNYRTGPREFWGSILTIVALGLGGLLLASLILPRAWQEKNQSDNTAKGASKWRRLRFGTAQRRRSIRELLPMNPFHWLAVRDRLSQIGFWIVAGVLVPFWLVFLCITYRTTGPGFGWVIPFQLLVYTSFGLSLLFKCLVAGEASRRLNDDRKSGALELLLVTPLNEQHIVDGQRRALWNLFFTPIILIEILFAVVLWLNYGVVRFAGLRNNGLFAVIMLGNMIVLLTDFSALGWAGMWAGLRARHHHRAVVVTLLQILVLPWVLYFLLGVAGFFNSRGVPTMFFCVWFAVCVVNDLLWARLARRGLMNEFRLLATGATVKQRGSALRTIADYSNA